MHLINSDEFSRVFNIFLINLIHAHLCMCTVIVGVAVVALVLIVLVMHSDSGLNKLDWITRSSSIYMTVDMSPIFFVS